MKVTWLALLGLCLSTNNPAASQSYFWPTNASNLLSSSFAEYRSNHFHAGIDIKTFGQNGLPVFATRTGYIWLVRVSPYGYGRVIYQKLDSGEIAVYAHLQKFAEKLETEIKREQQRLQEFTINKYFEPDEFPVAQGDIIAFTGESGIGPSHLHFEIRDAANNPINPLSKNFPVKDTLPPVIRRLSILPLEAGTEINGELATQIQPVLFTGKTKYQIPAPIRISGAAGLAVDCYDPVDLTTNKLGIYSLKLFVDGQLLFAAVYDSFTHEKTNQIVLDRDFRLMRQGADVFYRCFRDRQNTLEFYEGFPPEAGILHSRNFAPQFPEDWPTDSLAPQNSGLSDSLHAFKIEIADYFQNSAQVTGHFLFQAFPELAPEFTTDENGKFYLTNPERFTAGTCRKFSIYLSDDWGESWYPVYSWSQRAGHPQPAAPQFLAKLSDGSNRVKILKMTATDWQGREFRPCFRIVQSTSTPSQRPGFLTLKKEYFDDFIGFEILSSIPLMRTPEVRILPENEEPGILKVRQTDLKRFNTSLKLGPEFSTGFKMQIFGESVDGKGMFHEEEFRMTAVLPDSEITVGSTDGLCKIYFPKGSVYQTLFCRIENQKPEPANHLKFCGLSYQVAPFDMPLKSAARISIKYPPNLPDPEKLGVYVKSIRSKNSWRFAGNELDLQNQAIRAEVSSFDEYTLVRDEIPPEISVIYPANGAQIAQRRPKLQIKITDSLSGTRGDSQHIRLLLDGERVIAEFDPETMILFYQPDTELARGEHSVQITVRDRCQNVTERKFSFRVN